MVGKKYVYFVIIFMYIYICIYVKVYIIGKAIKTNQIVCISHRGDFLLSTAPREGGKTVKNITCFKEFRRNPVASPQLPRTILGLLPGGPVNCLLASEDNRESLEAT